MARATFSKSDLMSGMVVEYRNGKRRMVVLGCAVNTNYDEYDILVGPAGERFTWLDNFNDDLTHESKEELDIVAVYTQPFDADRAYDCDINGDALDKIWERETPKKLCEMTLAEVLSAMGYHKD